MMNKKFIIVIPIVVIICIVISDYYNTPSTIQLFDNETALPLTVSKQNTTFDLQGTFNPYQIMGSNCKCCITRTYYTCTGCWGSCPAACASACQHKEYACGVTYPEYSCGNYYGFTTDTLTYTFPDETLKQVSYQLDATNPANPHYSISIPSAEAWEYIDFSISRTFTYRAIRTGPCNIAWSNTGIGSGQSQCYQNGCPSNTRITLANTTWTVIWNQRWINETYNPPPESTIGSITGFVKNEENNLINATITLQNGQSQQTTTYNGEYKFTSLAYNTYILQCSAQGYKSEEKTINVDGNEIYNFILQKIPSSGLLSGIVKNTQGAFVNGAKIEVEEYECMTTTNGTYSLELQQGGYVVQASKEGYKTVSHFVSITASQTTIQDFILSTDIITGAISGNVRNSDTTVVQEYVTVEGATITLHGVTIEGATIGASEFTAQSDANGNFLISDIPPDTYDVTAQKEGYIPITLSDIHVKKGETTSIYFNLPPLKTKGEFSGDIHNLQGNPIPNVEIKIDGQGIQFHTILKSKIDGTFSIANLEPGTYYFLFMHPTYKTLDLYTQAEAGKPTSIHVYLAQKPEEEAIIDVKPIDPESGGGEISDITTSNNSTIFGIILLTILIIFGIIIYYKRPKYKNKRRYKK